MQYSHLHCHTQYSLLDGAAKISAMFKKAAADKMPAIAITDHGNMFGVFEFVAEASKHNGVKPIVGCEFYMVEDRHKRAFTKDQKDKRFHQLFLAKNAEGYANLTKMCSLGYIEGLYGKYPRIDKELILKYHKGLIATTCCLGAEVPQAILMHGEAVAREKFKWWLDLFGEDYYVELQRHKIPDQIKVNEVLLRFAKEFDVKVIASNDSHYVDRADSNAHDILLCLNTGEKQATPKMDDFDDGASQRGKRFAFYNDEFYFKTTAEMGKIFPDLPQALDNTNEIVAKIEPLKLKRDILLPNFVIPEGFVSQDEYLTHLTYEGAKERYKELTPQIEERLNFELFTVRTMGFAGYFLIVADFIKAGRDLGVFIGPGRGCLVMNTKIILQDGRTKDLEHIEIGDKVWTQDGSLQTVTNCFEYPVDETLLNIKSYYGEAEGVTMTKDHKVLAEKQQMPKNWDNWSESTRLARKKPDPTGNLTWMPACDLAVGDWVFIPMPNFNFKKVNPTSYNIAVRRFEEDSVEYKSSKAQTPKHPIIDFAQFSNGLELKHDNLTVTHDVLNVLAKTTQKTKTIPRYLELDDDWFKIFGFFAGDGWFRKEYRPEVSFVFNLKDEDWIIFFKNKMRNCGFEFSEQLSKKVVQIHVQNKHLYLLFKKIFHGYQAEAHSKHVPDIVINGNESQILNFLKGYCFADGHESQSKIKFTTVSRNLADQVRFICWRVGIPANLSTDKRIGDKREMFKNRTLAYMVSIPKDARIGNYDAQDLYVYRKVEGGILTKIRSITEVTDVKKVYDIEVENNHNYLTSSFLVHNSAAGSAIAYCIGITNIDPIKYNLLFERFLNPDRKSMPDIDTDFDDEGRQKVIDYVVKKYGKQQVAQITTYGTMAAKMSIKDVARVLDLPLSEANAMVKLVSDKPGIKLNRLLTAPIYGEGSLSEKENLIPEDIENAKALREILEGDDDRAKVLKEALILEGSVRGTGIHAAGIIIAPKDLTDIIPVYASKETDLLITQFEGSIIEDAGVIKMDFLGLKTLSIMRDALKLIKENYGITLNIDEIPLDDKKTYQLYQRGETNATFQFESPGMQKHLRDLKPDKFADLIAMNALYRPGPLQYIPNYINRKHGREKVVYDLDAMEEFLHETYGICVTGDTLIYNPKTGERARIDSLENRVGEYYVQGVDNQLNAQIAPITHWVCNGKKAVVEVKLNNGSTVKMTPDHRVLTESGWQEIGKLKAGDFIATPRQLKLEQTEQHDRRQLRVLAYLLADGAMSGSGSTAEFISKDQRLLDEYINCLSGFERLEPRTLMQIREVTRVMVAGTHKAKYHETNSLVTALRNWGLKTMKGGCTSDTKFIPHFVFKLSNEDIAFFLASYWDCDGHIGKRLCFIKTISKQIAIDIQTLLLRIGIHSTTYEAKYYNNRREMEMTAYQITVYNLKDFRDLIAPHLIAKTMHQESQFTGIEQHDSVSREVFLMEFKDSWQGTYRGFMDEYGFDRQHLLPKRRILPRIPINVIEYVSEKLDLVQTRQNSNVRWVEIKHIAPIGEELVYDITVADIHNFIGNNIILHNCIFQEDLMLLSQKLANFSKGDADVLRKAMGKKQLAVLDKMKPKFLAGCEKNGHPLPICEKVWTDWEAFASYAFNKSHSTCYAFVAFQTGYLKAHYPGEYMAAVLTHGQGNLEKITFFMEECRSMGIAVKSPDVNESDVTFTVNKKGEIRYALTAAKGVGEAAVAALIEERKQNGIYKDVFDFVTRSNSRTINKKVIESLVYAGAMDGFGLTRATYFSKPDGTTTFIEMLIKYGNAYQSQKDEAKVSLFGGGSNAIMTAPPTIPKVEEWNLIEKLNYEKEVVGIFLSGHPLDDFRMQVKVLEKYSLDKLEFFKNQKVKIAAFVTAVNERISKKGTPWGAITIQDYRSSAEFTLFNDDYARHGPILKQGNSVYIEAEYKTRYNSTEYELKITSVKLLESVSVDNLVNNVTIVIPLERITSDFIETMTLFCDKFKGKNKLRIQIQDSTNHLFLKLYSLDKNIKIDTNLLRYMDSEGWQYSLN